MLYFIVFFFIFLVNFLTLTPKSDKKIGVLIVSIILTLFASLRKGVGTDWDAYYDFYIYGVENVEIGYAFINNFFADHEISFFFFLLVINLFSIRLISKSALEFSLIPIFSLLIYYSDAYLYFNFSGMRQAIAMSLTTFALIYSFGDKRNKYLFFSLILLAMSFHITAIIFAIAYFIPQRKFTKKEVFFLSIAFSFFSSLVFLSSSFLTGIFATKAAFYLEHQEQAQNIHSLFIVGLLRRLITIILIFFFARKVIFKNQISSYLFNLYLIGFGIFTTTYLISPDIGVRMSIYFTVLEMFLLANLIYLVKRTDIKFSLYLIVIAVSIYKLYTYTLLPAYEYQSIL